LKLKHKILPSITVAAFFVLTLFIFAPSQLFLTNPNEFNATYFELLGYLAIIALPFFLVISAILFLLPDKRDLDKKVLILVLTLALLLWLQGNIMVWDYGKLTGARINFNIYFLVLTGFIWIALIITAFKWYKFFFKFAKEISLVFIAIQLISTSILVFNHQEIPESKRYAIDNTNQFTFSKEKNVIILVLDTFQSDTYEKIIKEDESFKKIFNGFTYYRDALAGFPYTHASIPNLLTGCYYDNSVPFSTFLSEAYNSTGSVPKVLKENGFEVDFLPDSDSIQIDHKVITNSLDRTQIQSSTLAFLFDAVLFRYSPDCFKNLVYNDGEWFLENKFIKPSREKPTAAAGVVFDDQALKVNDVAFIQRMLLDSITKENKNVFKFYRLNGAHTPYLLNEDLRYEKMAQGGYERQARAVLKLSGIFLNELKRLDIYDNSLIFVIGDHGKTGSFQDDIRINANPLFLVKRFNAPDRELFQSEADVSLSDIPDTIFSELNLKTETYNGSIFDLAESEHRERKFVFYNSNDDVQLDFFPVMEEYRVTGPVWEKESWTYLGRNSLENLSVVWEEGFSYLEGSNKENWRWCSSEGILTIKNTSEQDQKYQLSTEFATGNPERSRLVLESPFLAESLEINNKGSGFSKEITVSPGIHQIRFFCDAQKVEAPDAPRTLVFRINNFELREMVP